MLFFLIPQISAEELCSPPGIFHKIKRGQTIWSIARAYGIDILEIMKYNNLEEPSLIYAGRYLFIPGANRPLNEVSPAYQIEYNARTNEKTRFIWPVQGKAVSFFGFYKGRRRNGIEIACRPLTPVNASEKGVVVSAGIIRGYGNMIIVDHRNGFHTIYGYNERNLASRGEEVEKGEQIAIAGSTGRTDIPSLYFEIRKGSDAVDPFVYLPR